MTPAFAAERIVPSLGWSLDRTLVSSDLGEVTGTSVAFTDLISCGAITTDAGGNFICSPAPSGSGDITGVTAGSGLTGGGTSGDVTVNAIGTTNEIEVSADAIGLPDDVTITTSLTVGSTGTERLTFTTSQEYIDGSTDDVILFQGVGGSDNTSLQIDLDGTHPVLSSPTDTTIELAEDLLLTGTGPDWRLTPTGGDTIHFGAEYAAATGTVWFLSNATDGTHFLLGDDADHLYLPRLATVEGVGCLEVLANGRVTTETCGSGGGAGDLTGLVEGTGIDISDATGPEPTVNVDTTEIGTTTWGSGSGFAWTMDAGATDPVLTFGDGTMHLSTLVGIGTSVTPSYRLEVTNSGSDYGTPVVLTSPVAVFGSSTNGIAGVAMKNANSGTSADFRMLLESTDGDYLTFALPGESNNLTLFGANRKNTGYVFTNTSGGSGRALALGTVSAHEVILGTNNTSRMSLGASGGITLTEDLAITRTGPDLTLTPTGGDTIHLGAEYAASTGTIWFLSNSTDGQHYLEGDDAHRLYLPQYPNCTLKTVAGGKVTCGTDETTAGGGDVTDVNEGTGIDVTNSAGPAPTVAFDSTEIGTTTWGSGSTAIWTFDAGATDPTLTTSVSGSTASVAWNDSNANVDWRIEGVEATELIRTDGSVDRVRVIPTTTRASADDAIWDGIILGGATATVTGSTQILTNSGFNLMDIQGASISSDSGVVIDHSATLHLQSAPSAIGSNPPVLSDNLTLWIDNGGTRFDGFTTVSGILVVANQQFWTTLPSCTGDIETDAQGKPYCGTDETTGAAIPDARTNESLPLYSAKLADDYVVFTPPTADACTQGAEINASEGNWKLLFDATTDECAEWQGILPTNYASAPLLDVVYSMASGTANEVEFEGAIMCVTPGDAADISTASFSNVAVASGTVPGTAGHTALLTITLTDDSCAAGDVYFVVLSTDANDATNDDATGDREVQAVNLRFTGS